MSEIWKEVPGYNGRYEVSSLGKVRRSASFMASRRGGPTTSEVKPWDCHGYAQVKLELHGMAKLTAAQAEEIRGSRERGVDLAKRFGVTPAQISLIRKGKSWRTENANRRAEMNLR